MAEFTVPYLKRLRIWFQGPEASWIHGPQLPAGAVSGEGPARSAHGEGRGGPVLQRRELSGEIQADAARDARCGGKEMTSLNIA